MRTIADPTSMKNKYTTPITTKVCATPTCLSLEKCCISQTESGEAMKAPPPKPMMAMPVAMPGRSGNHLISVDTGEM